MLWCLRANYMYYRFAQRRLKDIRQQASSAAESRTLLSAAGGTSLLNVILVLGMQFVITRITVFLLMIIR